MIGHFLVKTKNYNRKRVKTIKIYSRLKENQIHNIIAHEHIASPHSKNSKKNMQLISAQFA